jgi:glutaredoxin
VKEFLSQRDVEFTVRAVDEDDSAYDELLALGYRTIPVTVINGTAVRGYDPSALERALSSGG